MARIDYDEDDDTADAGGRPGWRRRLLTIALVLVGLALGFLIPYVTYLNHEVGQRFGQLRWQLPTRVYARPLEVAPGVVMDAATLKTELDAAAYHAGDGAREGTYAQQGGRWTIASRGFADVDGAVPARRVEVILSGGRVMSVRDAVSHRSLRAHRLDPARIATLYGQKQEERRLVRINEVPDLLVTGLQAVEDRDFNHHIGIDFSGLARAVLVNLRSGEKRQGASTLTQQLARSGLLGIGQEQTFTRKFKEIIYALLIDARYDKSVILEAYFNQVYLGQHGSQAIRGVAAGAEFWFGRDLNDLNTEQIALLIGIVRGPSYYDPRVHGDRALERRNFVLDKMLETGLIDQAEHDRAQKAPLGVTPNPTSLAPNRFPAYVDLVRRQLARDFPSEGLVGAGLSVMTAMSPSAQAYAEGAVTKTLRQLESPKRPPLEAGVVVTNVHTGEIVAAVGAREFTEHGFNRAVEAQRPVGSLLKPFVYLLALAEPNRWSLASYVEDSPITVKIQGSKPWSPGNSDGRSHGTVRVIDALALSMNQATVRVGMQVTPQRLADLIRTLAGIEIEGNVNPSLILGAVDESPYAMAQLYQFLASGGQIQPLRAVRGVLDANGRALNRYDKPSAPAQPGDAVAARLVTYAMQQVVNRGTAHQLIADGRGGLSPAGKTGTSNDGRDSWFAGFTGDHLAVIWVGNDQNKTTGLYGATGAMRVWSALFAHLPSAALKVPDDGLDWQWVAGNNTTDPGCPGSDRFPFVPGYAPGRTACAYGSPNPVSDGSEDGADAQQQDSGGGFWNSLFGRDHGADPDPAKRVPPPADTAPPPEPAGGNR
ncbi:penicillin-binding protein 1B [Lysobacter claricitrinus]|uniref:penicillin-binding protein 1B n=1 Tax=Lysobacter claricitrinus TaxID=3367728 RepID=UPI0037DBC141